MSCPVLTCVSSVVLAMVSETKQEGGGGEQVTLQHAAELYSSARRGKRKRKLLSSPACLSSSHLFHTVSSLLCLPHYRLVWL